MPRVISQSAACRERILPNIRPAAPLAGSSGSLTPERERWAEAALVERFHGDTAEAFIAERIETLALVDDQAGVTRWTAIAARLGQLRSPGPVQ